MHYVSLIPLGCYGVYAHMLRVVGRRVEVASGVGPRIDLRTFLNTMVMYIYVYPQNVHIDIRTDVIYT